jgi:hypothetical protein
MREVERRLVIRPHRGRFSSAELDGLPDVARRMLAAAIAPGAPLAASARLRMRGSIKLNRWLSFRATQVIAPGVGFLWRARVAGLIHGYDRSLDGEGEMRWTLGGVFTVASGSGPDVSRSSAGREVGEAFWVPTTLLPRFGVHWRADDDRHAIARIPSGSDAVEVTYEVGDEGEVRSLAFQRWGDPDGTGQFAMHSFGGTMTKHETFGGVTIPTRGTVGWHFGQPSWPSGEFFRFQIDDLQVVR